MTGGVVRFLYNVVIGNVRGPAFLGIVGSALSTAMFAAVVYPQAVATAATTFVSRAGGRPEEAQDRPEAVAWYLAKHLVLVALFVGAGAGVAAWLLTQRGALFAFATGLLTVGYSAYIFGRSVQFATYRARRAVVADAVSGLVALALLVLVLLRELDDLVLLPLALGYGAAAAITWPRRSGPISRELRTELRRFIAIGSVGAVASGGFLQLSMVAAKILGSPDDAGLYAAALSIATPLSMVSTAIAMVVVPAMGAAVGRSDITGFRQVVDRAARGVSALALAGFGMIAALSPVLVALFYPDGYSGAVPLLAVLAAAMLCLTSRMPVTNALAVRSPVGIRTTTTVSLAATALGIAVWALAGPRFGVAAVAVGVLAGNVLALVWLTATVARQESMPWLSATLRHGVVLVLAVLLAVVVALVDLSVGASVVVAAAYLALWAVLVAVPDRGALLGLLGAGRGRGRGRG